MLDKSLHFSVCEELKITRQKSSLCTSWVFPTLRMSRPGPPRSTVHRKLLVRWVMFSLKGTIMCQTKRLSRENQPQLRPALARPADVVCLLQMFVTHSSNLCQDQGLSWEVRLDPFVLHPNAHTCSVTKPYWLIGFVQENKHNSAKPLTVVFLTS